MSNKISTQLHFKACQVKRKMVVQAINEMLASFCWVLTISGVTNQIQQDGHYVSYMRAHLLLAFILTDLSLLGNVKKIRES